MALRTTASAVQQILGPNYDGTTDLEQVMTTANVFVDLVAACATRKGRTLTTAQLERIEAYLSAHFYGHGDQFYSSRSTQGASGSFQGNTGQIGIEGSQYGQTALRLDTSGCLNGLNNKARVGIFWAGTKASNVTRTGGE